MPTDAEAWPPPCFGCRPRSVGYCYKEMEVASEDRRFDLANFDMKHFARRGAEARLAELSEEMEGIYAAFPDLRRGTGRGLRAAGPGRGSEGGNGRSVTTGGPARGSEVGNGRRGRRKMTAAQRKAVGMRMKKYWAERRAEAAAKKR
jgi:hypothetical protein